MTGLTPSRVLQRLVVGHERPDSRIPGLALLLLLIGHESDPCLNSVIDYELDLCVA